MSADTIRHGAEVLRVPNVSAHVLSEVRGEAQMLEELCGFPVAVVHNPFSIGVTAMAYTFQLVVCVSNASPEEEQKCSQCVQEFCQLGLHAKRRLQNRIWDWLPALVRVETLNDWFSCFRDDPDSFPLKNAAAGAILISPILWGADVISDLRGRAKDFFGDEILSRWVRAARQGYKERQARIKAINDEIAREATERVKLLNEYELRELQDFLVRFSAEQTRNPFSIVVGLDGSGRPIAKAIQWVTGNKLKVMFMDPHHLKSLHEELFGEWLHDKLALEMPELHDQLQKDPTKVLFVDDQTGYGATASSLNRLVRSISSRENGFRIMHMSQYDTRNLPSWHRRRDLQGIELVDDAAGRIDGTFTFLSLDRPTAVSKDFYSQLKQHVLSWGLNLAPVLD